MEVYSNMALMSSFRKGHFCGSSIKLDIGILLFSVKFWSLFRVDLLLHVLIGMMDVLLRLLSLGNVDPYDH